MSINEADDRGSSEYNSSEIDLEINSGDGSVSGPDKIRIDYRFDLEWRSWGIKDIEIALNVNPQFDVTLLDGENSEVTVPFENINITWVPGKHYIPLSLSVEIDEDSGDVKSADLNVSYIEH